MDEALQLLHTPLGQPGSGRVRYGAAMELWRGGLISEAQLDVYRDASPFDGRDPAPMLAERGLPAVPRSATTAMAAVKTLFDAAAGYLNTLSHPGAAEVRAGLAACSRSPREPAPGRHPVADRWLVPALGCLAPEAQPLKAAIAQAAPYLRWLSYDVYPTAEIGEAFARGHAFASLAGVVAPFAAHDFEFGLFLIAPNLLYRDHCHRAPELYVPLTGPHGWRFAPDRPLIVKPAGEPVWNPPHRPHLTKVGPTPFLGLFAWTRDVDEPARVLPAGDWAALERFTPDWA